MHNVNDITELVISKLTQYEVPLTQEDKGKIWRYIHYNDDKVSIIIRNLARFPIGSVVGAMCSFVYKKSDILGLLEVIADKDKHKNIVQKVSKYCDSYRPCNKEFLMENLQEFLAFRAFICDESECQWGKNYESASYKVRNRNWTVAYNNYLLVKNLLIHDKIDFKILCAAQSTLYYNVETLEEGVFFEVLLKKIEEKVKDHVEKQNSIKIHRSMIDFSNEKNFQLSERQPNSLFKLAAIELINQCPRCSI